MAVMATVQYGMFSLLFVFLGNAAIGRAATISFGVAQSICIQQSRFTTGEHKGVLEGPLKYPLSQRRYGDFNCIHWDANCSGKDNKQCPLFRRNFCPTLAAQPPQPSGRIIGGKETAPHSYPSHVFLKALLGLPLKCGGTILNQNWVLTAKHCIQDYRDYNIIAGAHYDNVPAEGQQEIEVEKQIVQPDRPDQNGKLVPFDLILLRLVEPLKFTDNIKPVTLPTRDYPTGDVTIIGRGVKDDGRNTNVNREVTIPIISLSRCREVAGPDEVIKDWEFCLQDEQRNVSGCFGDSGGPGYIFEDDPANPGKKKQVLVGVISYGIGKCFNPPQITGLVSIFSSLEWINENIKN